MVVPDDVVLEGLFDVVVAQGRTGADGTAGVDVPGITGDGVMTVATTGADVPGKTTGDGVTGTTGTNVPGTLLEGVTGTNKEPLLSSEIFESLELLFKVVGSGENPELDPLLIVVEQQVDPASCWTREQEEESRIPPCMESYNPLQFCAPTSSVVTMMS